MSEGELSKWIWRDSNLEVKPAMCMIPESVFFSENSDDGNEAALLYMALHHTSQIKKLRGRNKFEECYSKLTKVKIISNHNCNYTKIFPTFFGIGLVSKKYFHPIKCNIARRLV